MINKPIPLCVCVVLFIAFVWFVERTFQSETYHFLLGTIQGYVKAMGFNHIIPSGGGVPLAIGAGLLALVIDPEEDVKS